MTDTAVLACVVKEGRVLLMKRGTAPFQGYWSFPGGLVDEGETAEEACVREVKEETGIEVTVIAEIARVGLRIQDTPVFLCTNGGGVLNVYPPETLAVSWVPFDRLHKLKLVPFIKEFMKDV